MTGHAQTEAESAKASVRQKDRSTRPYKVEKRG